MVTLFLSSRRGRSVNELSAPRNRSESPSLDAQQHSCTALAPVGLAPMTAAVHPPSLALWGFASTAQMERASTEMSCGSSAAAAIEAVVYTADPPALQSAFTTTSIPSGTEADSSCLALALACHTGQRLLHLPTPQTHHLPVCQLGERLPPPFPNPGNTLACTLSFLPRWHQFVHTRGVLPL